ncbi:MAG TPA: hypothetical protein VFH89_11390 [Sphingomicrobium sp.]|nr:hypothetical protein [Sphingomicrobium sp.]
MKRTVNFALEGTNYSVEYDTNLLKIGGVVHVLKRADDDPVFSHKPSPGSVEYCVGWISPSDWSVPLENSLVVAEHDVNRISAAIGTALSKEEVRRALFFAAGDVPIGKLHLAETWHTSVPGKCLAVAERLHLVALLRRPEIEKEIWWHSAPLINYLLLTCFDILGQSDGWTDFGSWLDRKKDDGPDVSKLTSSDPIKIAKELYEQWLDKYGTKRSFYRFVNETLDSGQRQKLFDSVDIKKYPLPPAPGALSKGSRIETTDKERLRFLYKLRNSFTHEARGTPGKYPGPDRKLWTGHGQAVENGLFKDFGTINWPDVLVDCVTQGLVTVLKQQLALSPSDLVVPNLLADGPGRR